MTKKRRAPDISLSEIKTRVREPCVEVGERKPALVVGETLQGVGRLAASETDPTTLDGPVGLASTLPVGPERKRLSLRARVHTAAYLNEPLELSPDDVLKIASLIQWTEAAHSDTLLPGLKKALDELDAEGP